MIKFISKGKLYVFECLHPVQHMGMEVWCVTSLSSVKPESPHEPHWVTCADWVRWRGKVLSLCPAQSRSICLGNFIFVQVKGKRKVPKSGRLFWCLSEWASGWHFCSVIPALQPRRTYAETDILGKACFSSLIALPFWTCSKVKHFWMFDISIGFSPIERQPNN